MIWWYSCHKWIASSYRRLSPPAFRQPQSSLQKSNTHRDSSIMMLKNLISNVWIDLLPQIHVHKNHHFKTTKEIRAFQISCSFCTSVLFEVALINIVMSTMDLVVTYVKVFTLTDEQREVWLNSAALLGSGEQFITFSSLCWFSGSIFTVTLTNTYMDKTDRMFLFISALERVSYISSQLL